MKLFIYIPISLVLLTFGSCNTLVNDATSTTPLTAQKAVNKALEHTGSGLLNNSLLQFKFRDYYYRAIRKDIGTTYERCLDKDCKEQRDLLDIDGTFKRFRENVPIPIPDSMQSRFAASVNSVHYFSVLPFGLNAPAVEKKLIDENTVGGKTYYRVQVTFKQEGGGEDFQDVYLYWIHKDTYEVDYLAYNYQVDGGGTRFREAYNKREINGVTFADYRNYKSDTKFPPLTQLDSLFDQNKLKLLSKIEIEEIELTLTSNNKLN